MLSAHAQDTKSLRAIYSEVLASYYGQLKERVEKHYVFYRFVYRPLSVPLAAIAIRAGIGANAVTLASFFILVGSLVLLASGAPAAMLVGGSLFFAYYVCDFVDGNIARYHRQSSFFGKLIDGMVDTMSFFVFTAVAVGNVRSGQSWLIGEWEAAVGLATTFSALIRQNYRWRLAYLRLEIDRGTSAPAPTSAIAESPNGQQPSWIRSLFDNLSTCTPLLLMATLWSDHGSLFVVTFFALYAIGGNLETIASILKNRASLQHRREH